MSTRITRWPIVQLGVLLMLGTGCTERAPDNDDDLITRSDTLTFEGEFRMRGGTAEWMRCTDGRTFKVQGPAADSLFGAYRAQAGHIGAAVKVWLRGGWDKDSTVHALKLVHMAGALRCPPVPRATVSGRFTMAMGSTTGDRRWAALDLFPTGMAIQYATFRDGPVREEFGTWGLDSDGVLQLTWPQRPTTLTFLVRNDSLVQHNARMTEATAVFTRDGHIDPTTGTFGHVRALLLAQPGVDTSDVAALGLLHDLRTILPRDSGLVLLGDAVAQRYGMDAGLRERRWSNVTTVQDLIELVRTLNR